jgi:hypothetical protein
MAAVASVYPLGDVMAAVRDRLVARGEAVAQENAADDFVTPWWCSGVDWVSGTHAPPRYVWFPTRIEDAPPYKGDLSNQERAITSGIEVVEVHCWGVDIGQAWALRRNLFRAFLANVGAPSFQNRGATIVANGGQLGTHGVVIVQTLGVLVPVTDDPEEIVTPVEIEITANLLRNGVESTAAVIVVE